MGLEGNWTGQMGNSLDIFAVSHPYVTYVAHIFTFSLAAGMYGMFCAGINFIIPKYSVLYTVSFFEFRISHFASGAISSFFRSRSEERR